MSVTSRPIRISDLPCGHRRKADARVVLERYVLERYVLERYVDDVSVGFACAPWVFVESVPVGRPLAGFAPVVR
ncbi:hypothetical protein, partial [Rhodococcus sp. A14]|uniref:hypothetical protein n=1 Tax=Rhodococcus sp. A14 TaxID=1194106 RepID=UPI001981BF91